MHGEDTELFHSVSTVTLGSAGLTPRSVVAVKTDGSNTESVETHLKQKMVLPSRVWVGVRETQRLKGGELERKKGDSVPSRVDSTHNTQHM